MTIENQQQVAHEHPTGQLAIAKRAAPAHAVVAPAHAVVAPADAVVAPADAVVAPAHVVVAPAHAVVAPAHAVVAPAHAVVAPADAVVAPEVARAVVVKLEAPSADPYQQLRRIPFDENQYTKLCDHFLTPKQSIHSTRESVTRSGAIRSTPRFTEGRMLIDNLSNKQLTQKLLNLRDQGDQVELLWSLRCLERYHSGVGRHLPPQLRPDSDFDTDVHCVVDLTNDELDPIEVEKCVLDCLVTKVVKAEPGQVQRVKAE